MTGDEIRDALLQALADVAPEVEIGTIESAKPLRRQVDLDSADWLNFLVAVKQGIDVDIPDAAAARLDTLDKLVAYCAAHGARASKP